MSGREGSRPKRVSPPTLACVGDSRGSGTIIGRYHVT